MITQVINGKRRIPEDFEAFDGDIVTVSQIFRECKMTYHETGRFSIPTKAGKTLTLLIDMVHRYPNFSLKIDNKLEYYWAYMPESNKEWLFHTPYGDGEIIGKRIILNEVLEKIRNAWNNN